MLKLNLVISLFLALGLVAPGMIGAQTKVAQRTTRTAVSGNVASPGTGTEIIMPFSTIYAAMKFTDDGTTLTVQGSGGGFNPGLSYTSFFYGTGSVRSGSLACLPPTPNLLTATQMITAYWLPVTSTFRTLYVQKTGPSYVPLTAVATFSVRYDSTPTLPLNVNLNPGRFFLNSCGSIR